MSNFKYSFEIANLEETEKIKAIIKYETDQFFKGLLFNKKIFMSYLYINNTNIPQFIPLQAEPDYFLIEPNCPNTIYYNTMWNVNSLKYFINFRNNDNSHSLMAFIQHQKVNQYNAPSYIPTQDDFYTNKYYYYYDYVRFLKIIESTINSLLEAIGQELKCYLQFDGQTYTLFLPDMNDYDIEFSDTLINILPFNTEKSQYSSQFNQLLNSSTTTLKNNEEYSVNECPYYDTVFPFSSLSIETNLPIHNTRDYSNKKFVSKLDQNNIIYNLKFTGSIYFYNFFEEKNTADPIKLSFSEDKFSERDMIFYCYINMKNGIKINLELNPNQRFQMDFVVEENEK